jgi:hypothetical protein
MDQEYESDGLSDFDLEQIGMRTGAFGGARLLKYVTDHFVTREGEVIGPERELAALGLKKVIQKFVGQRLVDTIVVADGEKVPDIAAMNEQAPREQWGADFQGNPAGPYTLVLVLKLLDPTNMERFAFITSSKGGAIGVGDLSDKVKIMRRFRGPGVVPVVSCSTTAFRIARLNVTRKRPDFRVVRWITLGDSGGSLSAPKSPKPLAAPASVEKPATPKPAEPPAKPVPEAFAPATLAPAPVTLGPSVEPPTLAEEMGGDAVPF